MLPPRSFPRVLSLLVLVPTCVVPLSLEATLASRAQLAPSLEATLVGRARPLDGVRPADAGDALARDGVARVDGVLPPETAAALRARILELLRGDGRADGRGDGRAEADDRRFVPGTRLRFASAMKIDFAGTVRQDLLLPLEDEVIGAALRAALARLRPALEGGAAACIGGGGARALELTECAALVTEPGATHQYIHADIRRDATRAQTVAPRLVCFVAAQDVPSARHGATCFLPGTATRAAHAAFYGPDDRPAAARPDPGASPRLATLRAGDAAIYDASVLHFGGANEVEGNTRVIFYFAVSPAGERADAAEERVPGYTAMPPQRVADLVAG